MHIILFTTRYNCTNQRTLKRPQEKRSCRHWGAVHGLQSQCWIFIASRSAPSFGWGRFPPWTTRSVARWRCGWARTPTTGRPSSRGTSEAANRTRVWAGHRFNILCQSSLPFLARSPSDPRWRSSSAVGSCRNPQDSQTSVEACLAFSSWFLQQRK